MARLAAASACGAFVSLLLLTTLCPVSHAYYVRGYAIAQKVTTNEWDGGRVYMEIRNGSIDDEDADNGLFIANALWLYTDGAVAQEFIEAGYTRGWNCQDTLTGYWASRRWSEKSLMYTYSEHKIINCTWAGGDHHWFKMMHHDGTSTGNCSWRVFIDGNPVVSGDGVSISTSHRYPYASAGEAGIEVIASSGKLGTASDYCDLDNISATLNDGDTWPAWSNPTSYATLNYFLYKRWDDYPSDFENYRNW